MASSTNPRNAAILAALVLVLAAVVAYRLSPSSGLRVAADGRAVKVGSYSVPSLGWDRMAERTVPTPASGRNVFTYGPPPTPTPDRRPTPTPLPTRPPEPTPTPPGIYQNGKLILPPPPKFTLSYIGWLGPDRLQVAIFRDGEDVLAVPVGERVKDRFIVREVGAAAVTIGFVGYPADVTSKVALAR